MKRTLQTYEQQTEEQAVAEDEAAFEDRETAVVEIPRELVPAVRTLIADYERNRKATA